MPIAARTNVDSSRAEPPDLETYLPLFGLSAFRAGQKDVIQTVLSGRDCLCVMPTGAGKSLCYQLPAVARDGLTLVVSPLIALMKDQVDALRKLGLRATFINSTLPLIEQQTRLENMASGQYDLVYVVPERFRSPRFLEAVRNVRVQLMAVDEAHCVSEWGHDFRPDYAKLGRYRRMVGSPPTIALTATATQRVRLDIVDLLNLDRPATFVTGFARPNLHYAVEPTPGRREKDAALVRFLKEHQGTGIVYAATRKACEEVAETIAAKTRRRVTVYHAGLPPLDRRDSQDAFMRGDVDVIVATNAFGMGIDKRDVRFVVHYNFPGSLEAYYQEAGRAGRDGLPSRCLMLYSPNDRRVQEYFIESAYPAPDTVRRVYDHLRKLDDDPIQITQESLREALDLSISADGVGTCEQLLEKAEVLQRLEPCQNMAVVRIDSDLHSLVDLLPQSAKVQRKVLRAVEQIVGPRRFELVYFNRRDLLRRCELDAAAAARALAQLRSLDAFDYVPPFRGRAIRMLERKLPFAKLPIDFDTMQQRKKADFAKLASLIGMAESRCCREQEVLHYFGEPPGGPCGRCDNCLAPSGAGMEIRRVGYRDRAVMQAVRMALSGVARCGGKFGKTIVAQMLCGSGAEKVKRFRLHQLSTFGLLDFLSQGEVVVVLEGLLAAGCLEQIDVDRDRPVLHLTELGQQVMQSRATLEAGLRLPGYLFDKLRGAWPEAEGVGDDDLHGDLHGNGDGDGDGEDDGEGEGEGDSQRDGKRDGERGRLYTEHDRFHPVGALHGNHDENENENQHEHDDSDDAYEAHNIGDAAREVDAAGNRDDRHEAVAPSRSASSRSGRPPSAPSSVPPSSLPSSSVPSSSAFPPAAPSSAAGSRPIAAGSEAMQPSHYWTWRLLAGGLRPAECAVARGIDPPTVWAHAAQAVDSGWPVRLEWMFSPEEVSTLEKVVGTRRPEQIRPILAKLPQGFRYEQVLLFLKCRQAP